MNGFLHLYDIYRNILADPVRFVRDSLVFDRRSTEERFPTEPQLLNVEQHV